MKQYNIAEAKSHFYELVKLALQGEEILIARDNKPLLKLTPVNDVKRKRVPGTGKGKILAIAPDFDETTAAHSEALEETAYLLRSPRNVRRLIESVTELEAGKGTITSPATR